MTWLLESNIKYYILKRADGREVLVFIDESDKCKDNYGSLVFLTICRNGGGYVMVIFGMDFDFEK